ncbi:hypothetical protein [Streptomyces sp. NPDC054961]
MSENEAAPEVTDLGSISSQNTGTESPTITVARERLVEAIGREAVFLADQRAGQASEGLEALARAFALVVSGPLAVADRGSPVIMDRSRNVILEPSFGSPAITKDGISIAREIG